MTKSILKKFTPAKVFITLAAILALGLLPRVADRLSAQYYNPYNTGTPMNYYSGNTSGGFSLNSNNSYCVGQTPVYTITAPSAMANQTIYWTSSHNGAMANQMTFTLNSSGYWSASGNSWGSGDVGQWTKSAAISGNTQSLNFSVQNCGNVLGSNTNTGTFGNPASFIGTSNDTFGAGPNAANIAFPVNTVNNSSPINSTNGFNTVNTPAPVYLANGTVLNGNQTTNGNSSAGHSYYDQNGYLCKPPGSW